MSGWMIATRELHRLGGGPLASVKFDRLGPTQKEALSRMLALELATRNGPKSASTYTLTPLGRDWCEGRAVVHQRKQPAQVLEVLEGPDDDLIEGALLEGGASVGHITPEAVRHLAATMFRLGRETVGAPC